MNLLVNVFLIFFICNYKAIDGYGKDWWKYTTIYEVYIRSFKDSDGDGIGDLQGIISKLDHFVDLGIETLWITPCFTSPMDDLGYDIQNFTDIDPLYGSMEDFDELLDEMNKRELKLLIDLVINHSSDEHPWFEKSINRIEPYTDYYMWVNATSYNQNGTPIPPNNWLSLFKGSAWTWNSKREQFYYHQFSEKQPDFNLRNSVLKKELKNALKFWLSKGIAGVRLDATGHYMEDFQLRDEPLKDKSSKKSVVEWPDMDHIYTLYLWGNYEFVHELRDFVDTNFNTATEEKILIAEAFTSLEKMMMFYGRKGYNIAHFPINLILTENDLPPYLSSKTMDEYIKKWLNNMPTNAVANWQSENHDNFRIGNRFSVEYMDIITMTILTLPGVACIYYGQEIGMMDYQVRPDQVKDPNNDAWKPQFTRDPERLPMQWDNSLNAGFTSKAIPWLPVNPDFWRVNVRVQKSQPNSRYSLYKSLSQLRKTKTLKYGNFKSYLISSWVYAFSRSILDEPRIITILNLLTETEIFHLHHNILSLPPYVKVLAASINAGFKIGTRIRTNPALPQFFVLRPLSAIVVSAESH